MFSLCLRPGALGSSHSPDTGSELAPAPLWIWTGKEDGLMMMMMIIIIITDFYNLLYQRMLQMHYLIWHDHVCGQGWWWSVITPVSARDKVLLWVAVYCDNPSLMCFVFVRSWFQSCVPSTLFQPPCGEKPCVCPAFFTAYTACWLLRSSELRQLVRLEWESRPSPLTSGGCFIHNRITDFCVTLSKRLISCWFIHKLFIGVQV